MNRDIKRMCLELARLALETTDVHVHIWQHAIIIAHFDKEGKETLYFENISFKYDDDVNERLEKAIDYVKSLGELTESEIKQYRNVGGHSDGK
ncbi:hypothetical protein [Clostridium sp.]|uniref:hypothetical protein n=1 Tax=Clostridium sp. TaxID=1506 RepID=UPI003217E114